MGQHSPARAPRRTRIAALAAGLLAVGAAVPLLASPAAATSGPVSGAVFTTDVTGAAVNANIYAHKADVYLDGGPNAPAAKRLDTGDYFFAVLAPGGQPDPNDGSANLLSTDGAIDRTFHANADGTVSTLPTSTHSFSPAGGVQLVPYADTPNPGGEYIVAVCRYVDDGNGGVASVTPSDCKYDAFKVRESVQPCTQDCITIDAPDGTKSATPAHDRTVAWTIAKSASPTSFRQLTPGTSTYTVTATKTVTAESWGVTGSITVTNPNGTDLPVTVADTGLDPAATALCTIDAPTGGTAYSDGSAGATVPANGSTAFNYSCTVEAPGTTSYANTASIGYTDGDNQPQVVAIGSGTFDFTTVTEHGDPEAVTVTDTNLATGSPGAGTVISDSKTFTYSRTFFNSGCTTYPNTAALSSGVTASASVQFCGPNAGGLTMGWWQNGNGQALLKGNLTAACAAVTGYVAGHTATGDLINVNSKAPKLFVTTDCADSSKYSYLPTFTYNTVKAANAAGSGGPMLLGQWLTTALDTAGYANYTSAGRPTLDKTVRVAVPSNVATALGLPTCTSVDSLLAGAVNKFATYSGTTAASKAIVTGLATVFDNLNNNRAQTCP